MNPTRIQRVTWASLTGLAALVSVAPAGEPLTDRALLDRAAAERTDAVAPSAAPSAAVATPRNDLDAAEEAAHIELAIAEVRLITIQARRAVQAGRFDEAAARANRVLELVASLPTALDLSVFELQAEGILAKAARAGVDVTAQRQVTLSPAPLVTITNPAAPANTGPSSVAAPFYGPPIHDDTEVARAADAEREAGAARIGRPAVEVFDGRPDVERDEQRIAYEGDLQAAYSADETERMVHADETRAAGDDIITYPGNWLQQKARRAAHADGVLARSSPWIGGDGKQWTAAIYDISDLTYVPPDFQLREGLTPSDAYWRSAALDALLYGSEIFRGYPDDLAGGVPLLRLFGAPLDDFEMRGPKYSAERAEHIANMIRALSAQSTEAKVEVITP